MSYLKNPKLTYTHPRGLPPSDERGYNFVHGSTPIHAHPFSGCQIKYVNIYIVVVI